MDAVTLAVVRGALEQIADQMDQQLMRAAISPVISEAHDCAHGIFHPVTGETIAQGRKGLPVFLAYMQFTVQNLIRHIGTDGFQEGDIWILNDPYFGGSHLQDVQLIAPYFVDGELFALLAGTGHWMDIGGNVPGGFAPRAQEIHQEGIIIPPVKLYEGGKLNKGLVDMFKANVRLPDEISGDLAAMANVFSVGQRGLDDLVQRHGRQKIDVCLDEMIERSERQMRSYISDIPDGEYSCSDAFDNDGITNDPVPVALKVVVKGDSIHLDFTGTSPCTAGPFNNSRNTTMSTCFVALKHIFPDVPINGGTFRAVTFDIPDGCLLAAKYPAPVGAYPEVVGRVIDLCFGALAQAIPDLVPAPFFGTTAVCLFGGTDPRTGRYFVGGYPYPGGYGGSKESDGLVNGTPPQSMANFMSIELSEHRFPILFDQYAIREDSGGPGWHRGGCGTDYGFTLLADCLLSILGDRTKSPPFGVAGGKAAALNYMEFRTDGKRWVPGSGAKQEKQPVRNGDGFFARSPGGGGFGDPLERDLLAVEKDLNLGYVSVETAERDYGAVILSVDSSGIYPRYTIDHDASAGRRKALAAV